jgi:hypothetical protein
MSDKVGQSNLESNGRDDPSQTPSAVIRLVDQSGVQWTYGSIHDVPIEQRSLLSESIVDLNMFESPPNRDPWQPAPESIAAVEIAEPKRPEPDGVADRDRDGGLARGHCGRGVDLGELGGVTAFRRWLSRLLRGLWGRTLRRTRG